jgi:Ca-activated chloride channel family protein
MQKPTVHAAFLIFALALAAFAQTPTPTPVNDDDVIKVESRLIVVPVSVTDADGQPVAGLGAKDFVLSEEGRPQEIAEVSNAEKVPLEIALLFDISATTNPLFDYQMQTAIAFLRDVMRPEDRATIFTIGERLVLVQSRENAERSAAAIRTIQPTNQQTSFFDSVREAAAYLQVNAPAGTRKVLLAITDGDDTNSAGVVKAIIEAERKLVADKISYDERRNFRLKAREVFYSINPGGNSYQLNQSSIFGQSNLQRFADETGGTAFLPKFQPVTLKDPVLNEYADRRNKAILSEIFAKLANELRAQYLVQYYSDSDFPENRYVNLKVGLRSANTYRIRARQGYFVTR